MPFGCCFSTLYKDPAPGGEGPAKDQHGRMQSGSSPWSLWMAVRDIYFANGHIFALSIQRERDVISSSVCCMT